MSRSSHPVCWLAACLLLAGCLRQADPSRTNEDDKRTEPAASWETQIGAVRRGEATRVQYDDHPLTSEQLNMLAEGCERITILEIQHAAADASILSDVLRRLPRLERLKLTGPVDDELLRVVAAVPTLKILNLPRGEFQNSALVSLERHPHLELLRFHSPAVSDDGLKLLGTLPNLRFLHLIDVPITDAGLPQLYGLTQLESFYLDGGDCTEAGLSELLRRLPQLHFHWNDLHLPDDPRKHPH